MTFNQQITTSTDEFKISRIMNLTNHKDIGVNGYTKAVVLT